MDNFAPTETSYLGVIDMDSDALVDMDPDAEGVQGIRPAGTNPNEVIASGQKLIVSGTAGFGDRAGGIEVVDLETNHSEGIAISEEALDGDLTGLAMASQEQSFAVVLGGDFVSYYTRPVDLSTGTVGAPLQGHSTGATLALAVDGARLIATDSGTADAPEKAGLPIYDLSSGELLAGPIPTGLPPTGIAILNDAGPTAVLEEAQQVLPRQARLNPLCAREPPGARASGALRFSGPADSHPDGWSPEGRLLPLFLGWHQPGRKGGRQWRLSGRIAPEPGMPHHQDAAFEVGFEQGSARW